MKNIFLITWYYSKNFGTVLQAYALMRRLESLGYNIRILDEFKAERSLKNMLKIFLGKIGLWSLIKNFVHIKDKRLQSFFKEEIKIKYVFTAGDLKKIKNETDVFISGSDQIWNPYYEKFSTFFMLDFAEGRKKIAYASSIGTDNFDKVDKERIKRLLKDYTHIGLREDSAVNFINSFLERKDVVQVLDPTFLLNKEEWMEIASSADYGEQRLPEKYMLCYLIGNNKSYGVQIENIAEVYGIKNIVVIPSIESSNAILYQDAIVFKDMGPREFVGLIAFSTLVCTDSFHATALSINMSKDFVEFKRFADDSKTSQNSRIYSLLSHYRLEHKMYNERLNKWAEMYDELSVQDILEKDRRKSVSFLINAIEN